MTDLHWLSAADIAKAYAARTLSPTELTQALLQRIEHLQPKLHAFIRLDADAAMDAARAAEVELQNGRTALRLVFPQRITAPGPLRAVLKQLAEQARAG